MLNNPEMLHALLNHLTEALIIYASYQIESGAQVCGCSFGMAPFLPIHTVTVAARQPVHESWVLYAVNPDSSCIVSAYQIR